MIDINKLIKKAKNFDDIFCIPNDKNIDKIIDEYSSIESIKILNKEKVKFEKLKKIKDYNFKVISKKTISNYLNNIKIKSIINILCCPIFIIIICDKIYGNFINEGGLALCFLLMIFFGWRYSLNFYYCRNLDIKDYTYLLPIKIIKKIKEIGKASIFDYISIICFRSCNNFKRGYKYSILVGTIKSFHEYTEHNEKKQYHFLIDTFKNDTTYNDLAK